MIRKLRVGKLPLSKDLFLSIISGSEAGIATTAAIIAGLMIGTDDRGLVVLSTMIAVLVQAFNSAITSVVTAHTEDEIEHNREMNSLLAPLTQAGLQFLTQITTGMVVLLPVVYVADTRTALLSSIGISLVLLFWIGLIVGRLVRHTPLRNSIRSFVLGILVICGGILAGYMIN